MEKSINSNASVDGSFRDVAFSKAKPLADRIGVSAKTIFRWANAGLISRRKVNARVVLFDIAEVINFVERCRVA